MKAILLYPMNALATDQAHRISSYLDGPALSGVSAGLYIGDTPSTEFGHVLTKRADIRRARPDVLITNYKMLDLLLQCADDLPLWEVSVRRSRVLPPGWARGRPSRHVNVRPPSSLRHTGVTVSPPASAATTAGTATGPVGISEMTGRLIGTRSSQ
ncbi:hypothetical protein [Streptosporangium sp. NPDC087985]|uniref:hypothetical protein n=1 Tax=Streptosporangium sp. NPDC087985 TaxID=3366196 RepID=UPI00381AB150